MSTTMADSIKRRTAMRETSKELRHPDNASCLL